MPVGNVVIPLKQEETEEVEDVMKDGR